jgi:hypothetical protein
VTTSALLVAILLLSASARTRNDSPGRLHRLVQDGKGTAALVSDTLILPSDIDALRSFASQFGDWRFVGPLSAAYRTPQVIEADKEFDLEHPISRSGVRFASDLHRSWLNATRPVRQLARAASAITSVAPSTLKGVPSLPATVHDDGWHMLYASVINVRRGDAVKISAACPPSHALPWSPPSCGEVSPGGGSGTEACPGDVVAVVYLTAPSPNQRQDDYGELTLFEIDRSRYLSADERDYLYYSPLDSIVSFAGVRARPHRAVVFPCEMPMRMAPPAVSSSKAILALRVVLTRDERRARESARLSAERYGQRGNSLSERLGFPPELFPEHVVQAQLNAIQAVAEEEQRAETSKSVEVDSRGEMDSDVELRQAELRTQAAEKEARKLADEGDEWALPLASALNVTTFERRVFETTGGRRLHVFDGLFSTVRSREWLRQLRNHVVANASYSFDDSTNEETQDDTDNVQWIVGLDESYVTRTHLWPILRAIMDHVTPWPGFWPYDVSVNVIRSWDHTLVHADCSSTELEYTLLMYLNDDLGMNDGAETVFFDDLPSDKNAVVTSGLRLVHRSTGLNPTEASIADDKSLEKTSEAAEQAENEWSELYGEEQDLLSDEDDEDDEETASKSTGYSGGPRNSDVLAIVRPIFGRVAIFNGNVPHSARPPYGSYPGIRYTMAVKMTSSRVAAVAKNLATQIHGTVDELNTKVAEVSESRLPASVRNSVRTKWQDMLQEAEALYEEVNQIKTKATAADKLEWSRQRPKPGEPWSTTSLTKGPPAMTADPKVLARLREISSANHVLSEAIEQQGWKELAAKVGAASGKDDGEEADA